MHLLHDTKQIEQALFQASEQSKLDEAGVPLSPSVCMSASGSVHAKGRFRGGNNEPFKKETEVLTGLSAPCADFAAPFSMSEAEKKEELHEKPRVQPRPWAIQKFLRPKGMLAWYGALD